MEDKLAKNKKMLERLFQATGAQNDSELAETLGLTSQAVYDARKRNKVPDAWFRLIAEKYDVSADWLLFGSGQMRRDDESQQSLQSGREVMREVQKIPPPIPEDACYAHDLVYDVVETLEEYMLTEKITLQPSLKAEVVRQLCQHVVEKFEGKARPGQMLRIVRSALAANE